MALSPSIPTSFVPKQPVAPGRRPSSSGTNILLIISIFIIGVSVAVCAGVFLYSKYLTGVENTKGSELLAEQKNSSMDTVTEFVRLRDRLTSAETILNQHVEISQFFTLLEGITLQNVHFSNMSITVAADRSATLELTGQAADFNTLADESTTFAAQKDIKSAIFSNIKINADRSVGFTIDAVLDPSIVEEQAPPAAGTVLPGVATTPTAPVRTAPVATTTTASTTAP